MFEHSVKVPRLYKEIAKVVTDVKEKGSSLKNLVYSAKHKNLKGLYSLAIEVLKRSDTLDYLIRSTQILIKEPRLNPWLARVLITELLWGKEKLPGESKPIQTILSYQNEFKKSLLDLPSDLTTIETIKVKKPRYARINTLKKTTNEVVDSFRHEGWTLVRVGDECDYGSYLATVSSLSSDQFLIDMHIKDLLVFPPDTQFYNHPFFLEGIILLQDKASCIAPLLLAPSPRSIVLDMCAAPGMKTSYLATMVGKKGKVYAIERDERRFKTLSTLMEKSGATNIKCINRDVMTITDKEIPNAQYILVDPSCSGSGMFDRLQIEDPNSKCNKSRLESLAGFQITILRHAMTNFPNAKRVVYSTCSIYPEENEYVVQEVIQSVKNFKLIDLRQQYDTKWFNFGSKDFGDLGPRCLNASPESDLTNGFFVAVFERISEDEINEFFVKRVVTRYDLQDNNKNTKNKKKAKNKNSVHEESRQDNDEKNIVNDEMIDARTEITKKNSKTHDIGHEERDSSKECKKSKKEKKLKNIVDLNEAENKIEISGEEYESSKKCKKSRKEKKKKLESIVDLNEDENKIEVNVKEHETTKKCKKEKKRKLENVLALNESENKIEDNIESPIKKKKKKSKNGTESSADTQKHLSY